MLTDILNIALMTWFFWVVFAAFLIWPLVLIVSVVCDDEAKFVLSPLVLFGVLIFVSTYHWPSLRPHVLDWHFWLRYTIGYVVVGFLVTTGKWYLTLKKFSRSNPAERITLARAQAQQKEEARESGGGRRMDARSIEDFTQSALEQAFPRCKVNYGTGKANNIYPNWRKYPIAGWWMYWPFYLLQMPFEFLQELITTLVGKLKRYFEGIALRFAVNIK